MTTSKIIKMMIMIWMKNDNEDCNNIDDNDDDNL